ncbi:MAG: hypothetical protein AAF357_02640 [Verrucomicrobiota bacterium]
MTSPTTSFLKRHLFITRSALARDPKLLLFNYPFVLWHQYKVMKKGTWESKREGARASDCWVTKDTELVIDGFQGSANSFATDLFQAAQTRRVDIAHHLHSPSLIIRGVNLDRPVIVCVREPIAAVTSLIRRWSHIGPEAGLRSYAGFYSSLIPYRQKMVISEFSQTIGGFGEVVEETNERYGTDFEIPDSAGKVALAEPPDGSKEEKKRVSNLILGDEFESARNLAMSAYERFTEKS